MGTILKLFAIVIVAVGIWTWASGRSVTTQQPIAVPNVNLSAAAALAPVSAQGAFDQEGTIVLDSTIGTDGTPFILYTRYNAQGAALVETKRLVFKNRDACAEANLPCATNQPGIPVRADDRVRVIGTVKDELVEVEQLYLL